MSDENLYKEVFPTGIEYINMNQKDQKKALNRLLSNKYSEDVYIQKLKNKLNEIALEDLQGDNMLEKSKFRFFTQQEEDE